MSDQPVPEQPVPDPNVPNTEIECGMCGHVGGVFQGCGICGGNARFNQSRAFTRSDEQRGENPTQNDRYGLTGDVSPKIVVVPGGRDPRQGQ